MNALAFFVPGTARGKGRPRATTIGTHARMYTDAKTASYENLVRLAAMEAMGSRAPFSTPVCLQIVVRVLPPASASRKARLAMLTGKVLPAKKPDLTNIVKAIEDGLNTVAYVDDALIVDLLAAKRYDEISGVDVLVKLIGSDAEIRSAA